MVLHETVCLRRLAQGEPSQEIRHGRFLANEAVRLGAIVAGWSERTGLAAQGRHVLAVQDTSEIQFAADADNRRGLGRIKKGNCRGLLLHAMLAVEADSGACLGLLGGEVWTRGQAKLAPHAERPLEEKESRRWIATAEKAKPALAQAGMVTFIADRESDFYALWASLPEGRHHALARVRSDHALSGGTTLRRAAAAKAFCEAREMPLRERPDRPARRALLCLRFGEAAIRRPANRHLAHLPQAVGLRWIEVVEAAPAQGQPPLAWLLLTSHAVETPAQAWQIVGWYRQRWLIEQFFRVLKRQGLDLEQSQLRSAEGLTKLTAIAAKAAAIVLMLTQARSGEDKRPASHVFTPSEIDALCALEQRFASKTRRRANPHPKGSLAWAAWVIARLGGWNGYAASKPPGPITFYNGLRFFKACADGWSLRDVYMP